MGRLNLTLQANEKDRSRRPLFFVLFAGLLIRLALMPLPGGSPWDASMFKDWDRALTVQPVREFYAPSTVAISPDHLPGDMVIYKVLAVIYSAFGGSDFGIVFEYFYKSAAILADFLLVWVVWILLKRLNVRRDPALVAAVVLFNPLLWTISAWWGQWDAINCLLALSALALALTPDLRLRHIATASGLLAWAFLIKPQLVILGVPILIVAVARYGLRTLAWGRLLRAIAVSGASGLTVVSVIMGLFGLTPRSLWKLASEISALHTDLAISTPVNFWWFLGGAASPASDPRWGTLSGVALSNLLVGVGIIAVSVIAWVTWRRGSMESWSLLLIGGLATAYFTYYYLSLVMHERYIFPAILLLSVWALASERASLWVAYALASFLSSGASFGVATMTSAGQGRESVWLPLAEPLVLLAAGGLGLCWAIVVVNLLRPPTKMAEGKGCGAASAHSYLSQAS